VNHRVASVYVQHLLPTQPLEQAPRVGRGQYVVQGIKAPSFREAFCAREQMQVVIS
jgi:hypothetical protein